jgi:hypothetical protein
LTYAVPSSAIFSFFVVKSSPLLVLAADQIPFERS